MAESIRFAVVRWNRDAGEAQPVVVDETEANVNGCPVVTVRRSMGAIWKVPARCSGIDVRALAAHELNIPSLQVAVVEVSASAGEGVQP